MDRGISMQMAQKRDEPCTGTVKGLYLRTYILRVSSLYRKRLSFIYAIAAVSRPLPEAYTADDTRYVVEHKICVQEAGEDIVSHQLSRYTAPRAYCQRGGLLAAGGCSAVGLETAATISHISRVTEASFCSTFSMSVAG